MRPAPTTAGGSRRRSSSPQRQLAALLVLAALVLAGAAAAPAPPKRAPARKAAAAPRSGARVGGTCYIGINGGNPVTNSLEATININYEGPSTKETDVTFCISNIPDPSARCDEPGAFKQWPYGNTVFWNLSGDVSTEGPRQVRLDCIDAGTALEPANATIRYELPSGGGGGGGGGDGGGGDGGWDGGGFHPPTTLVVNGGAEETASRCVDLELTYDATNVTTPSEQLLMCVTNVVPSGPGRPCTAPPEGYVPYRPTVTGFPLSEAQPQSTTAVFAFIIDPTTTPPVWFLPAIDEIVYSGNGTDACAGSGGEDGLGGTLLINGGDVFTSSLNLTLTVAVPATGGPPPEVMCAMSNFSRPCFPFVAFGDTLEYQVPPGYLAGGLETPNQTLTVYVVIGNAAGFTDYSSPLVDTIIYDPNYSGGDPGPGANATEVSVSINGGAESTRSLDVMLSVSLRGGGAGSGGGDGGGALSMCVTNVPDPYQEARCTGGGGGGEGEGWVDYRGTYGWTLLSGDGAYGGYGHHGGHGGYGGYGGVSTVRVYVRDDAANVTFAPGEDSILYTPDDVTPAPPNWTVLVACGAETTDSLTVPLLIIAAAAQDGGGGVAAVCVSNEEASPEDCEGWRRFPPGGLVPDWRLADGGAGIRTVWVHIRDSRNTTTPEPISGSILYSPPDARRPSRTRRGAGAGGATEGGDSLPPRGSLSILGARDGVIGLLTATLEIGGSDESGVSEMCISNGARTAEECGGWRPFAVTVEGWELEAGDEGRRTVFAYLRDAANNTMEVPARDSVYYMVLDSEPPTGTVSINGGAAEATSGVVTLSINATDDRRVDFMCITNDAPPEGGNGTSGCGAWEAFSATREGWDLAEGENGERTVHVYLRDEWGNAMAAPITDSITLNVPDTSGPNGTVTINGGVPETRMLNVSLAISASDPAGVRDMCISNNASEASEAGCAAAWAPFSAGVPDWSLSNDTGDGPRTVFVNLRDGLGNALAAPLSATIRYRALDVVTALVVGDGSGVVRRPDVRLSISAPGATGTRTVMCISVNGKYRRPSDCPAPAWVRFSASYSYTFPSDVRQGQSEFAIWFKDLSMAFEPVRGSFMYDYAPPALTLAAASPFGEGLDRNTTSSPTIRLSFNRSATDAGSGVSHYIVTSKKGSMPPKCLAPTADSNVSQRVDQEQGGEASLLFDGLELDAIYGFRICAVDGVNNTSNGIKFAVLAPGDAKRKRRRRMPKVRNH